MQPEGPYFRQGLTCIRLPSAHHLTLRPLSLSNHENTARMKTSLRHPLCSLSQVQRAVQSKCLHLPRSPNSKPPCRSIATHTYAHHASAVSVLPTSVDTSSPDYQINAQQMGDLMAQMNDLHAKIEIGGPQKAREKHLARGKMLPRECVSSSDTPCFYQASILRH